eukprot:SAG25_NODE_4845_length_741_cov_1.761682_1_plen_173_part_10
MVPLERTLLSDDSRLERKGGSGAWPNGGARSSFDASGEGLFAAPRPVLDTYGQPQQAALEDRGVRGAFLRCGEMELPLAFADIQRKGTTLNITIHAGVHPDCEHGGTMLKRENLESSTIDNIEAAAKSPINGEPLVDVQEFLLTKTQGKAACIDLVLAEQQKKVISLTCASVE